MNRVRRFQVAGGLALGLAALVGSVLVSPGRILVELAALDDWPVAFAVVLAVAYAVRPLVLWPISALSLLVGFVYGVALGVPVALAGAVYTSLPPYLLARYAPRGEGALARLAGAGRRITGATGEVRGLTAVRLAPLPADPVSYAAGLAGISLPRFVAGTAAGETPWVLTAVVAGSSMRTFTLAATGDIVPLLVASTALGLLLVSGPLYRHLRDRPVA